MELSMEGAIQYHYDQFPPKNLHYEKFIEPLLRKVRISGEILLG